MGIGIDQVAGVMVGGMGVAYRHGVLTQQETRGIARWSLLVRVELREGVVGGVRWW